VSRGRIGVQIDEVSKEVAESIGLGKAQGALVRNVEAGSPGEKGGVEAGDIITKFDGNAIEKPSDLPRLVGNTKPGTNSVVTVFRRGSLRALTLTVAEIEPEKPVKRTVSKEEPPTPKPTSAAGRSLGLAVSELSEAQKKELKLKSGVKIDAATDNAARAGLREGDVIIAIGNAEVTSVKEFEAAVGKADKAKAVNLLIRRGEWAQYALIKPVR